MTVKMLETRGRILEKGKDYKVIERCITGDGWIVEIKFPRSIKRAFVLDKDCEVVKEGLFIWVKDLLRA